MTMVVNADKNQSMSPLKSCSNVIVTTLEKGFYRIGLVIGKYPWFVILGCFVLLAIMVPGIPKYFYEENRQEELWISSTAVSKRDKAWVDKNYPAASRWSRMLLTGDNVLTPEFLKSMLTLDQKIKNLTKADEYTWETICIKLGSKCWSNSLLELWEFDEVRINALTPNDIINTINTVKMSPVYNRAFDAAEWLSDISRDNDNKIVSAKATAMMYWIKYNITVIDGRAEDAIADHWEKGFLDIAEEGHNLGDIFYYAFRSFRDEGGSSIFGDVQLLSIGYMLIFIFITVVLGRFNAIQHRVYCALSGILAVGIAMGIAIGIMCYSQIMWTPLHSTLPFLLIGIGVDDMFVIVQALDNIGPEAAKKPVPERIGLTMKHAGVAITVTSLTDILAFAVGAVTILPALRSFCAYCSIGILFTFIMQSALFMSCLAIDQSRVDARRNACCCCYVHKEDYKPNECSQKSIMQNIFGGYIGPALTKLPVKIAVIIVAIGLFALGVTGTVFIKQEFDPLWFIAEDSYASKYFNANDKYFPDDGVPSNVYLGEIDYYNNWTDLNRVHRVIKNDEFVDSTTVDCWFNEFGVWMNTTNDAAIIAKLNADNFPSSEQSFYELLLQYTSGQGQRFKRDLVYTDMTNSRLIASRFGFNHRNLDDSAVQIDAMDRMRSLTSNTIFGPDDCFAYSRFYLGYETNKVIRNELYRNLGLAFLCVFLMTLLLIANIWTCILVGICVIMTLVNVLGTAHFWNQTIDTVLAIQLIVGIGLAVDYSAHIGHYFMTVTGNRKQRVIKTMNEMGAAVFYGGFSTFLAFVLLAASKSYIFKTFFKIFFCVVFYGLFHGLLFLPVILSWVGPSPYLSAEEDDAEPKIEPSADDSKQSPDDVIVEPSNEKQPNNGNINTAFNNDGNVDATTVL